MYEASEYGRMSKQGLARAAGIVAFLTVLSKILGFFRETSLAAVFGATADVDAFLVAQTIPLLFFSIVSYALTTTFIPIYSETREKQGEEQASRFANTVMCLVLVIGVLLVAFGEIFAEALVGLVAPGFDEGLIRLATYLSRIIFPMMIFQLLSGVMTGILQANQNFSVPTTASLFQNLAIIGATLLFGRSYGISAVALGALLGTVISVMIKSFALRDMWLHWKWIFDFRESGVKRMLMLIPPAIVGAGATQLNVLVDRVLASGLNEGRIASLNYADKLMELAPGILGVSIVTVVYPTLAKMAARREWKELVDEAVDALGLIYFLLAPIGAGVLVLREPLVRIVFERGAFDAIATEQTAWALLFFSLGIGITTMRGLTSRLFFAIQDTTTPMILGFVTVIVNVVLSILFIEPFEHGGLALGTSVSSFFGLALGLWLFQRKALVRLPIERLVYSVSRVALASLFMGGIVWFIFPLIVDLLGWSGVFGDLMHVAIAAVIGGTVYIVLMRLMKVPEFDLVWKTVLNTLARLSRNAG